VKLPVSKKFLTRNRYCLCATFSIWRSAGFWARKKSTYTGNSYQVLNRSTKSPFWYFLKCSKYSSLLAWRCRPQRVTLSTNLHMTYWRIKKAYLNKISNQSWLFLEYSLWWLSRQRPSTSRVFSLTLGRPSISTCHSSIRISVLSNSWWRVTSRRSCTGCLELAELTSNFTKRHYPCSHLTRSQIIYSDMHLKCTSHRVRILRSSRSRGGRLRGCLSQRSTKRVSEGLVSFGDMLCTYKRSACNFLREAYLTDSVNSSAMLTNISSKWCRRWVSNI